MGFIYTLSSPRFVFPLIFLAAYFAIISFGPLLFTFAEVTLRCKRSVIESV